MEFNIPRLWEQYGRHLMTLGRKLVIAALIIIFGNIVIRLSRRLTHKAVTGKLHADETFVSALRMLIQYGVVIICLIMILDTFGINTTGLIALLGAAGVAVGFALKDTLGNIAAGIIILFLRPFRKDEFIECGSITGSVREIGLFAVILQTPDGIYISAPNSSLWGVPLKNYSRNPQRRMDIAVTIPYTDSIDTAFRVLNGIIAGESRFLKEPAPQVTVQSLGETGVGITLRAWLSGSDYWPVYWEQMKNVKEKIQEAGLAIAIPRREIRLANNSRETAAHTVS
jgi:small conductance mechanosensitive channel